MRIVRSAQRRSAWHDSS